ATAAPMAPRSATASRTNLPPPPEGTPAGDDGGGAFEAMRLSSRRSQGTRKSDRRFRDRRPNEGERRVYGSFGIGEGRVTVITRSSCCASEERHRRVTVLRPSVEGQLWGLGWFVGGRVLEDKDAGSVESSRSETQNLDESSLAYVRVRRIDQDDVE